MLFDYDTNVHEHIMKTRDIIAQLKSLELEISMSFFIHFILNSPTME